MPHIDKLPTISQFLPSQPPFPDDLPTAPLRIIDHEKLSNGDSDEIKALFDAARHLGFFYLNLQSSESGRQFLSVADTVLGISHDIFNLPMDTKLADHIAPNGPKSVKQFGLVITVLEDFYCSITKV